VAVQANTCCAALPLLTSHTSVCPGANWPFAGTTSNGSCAFQLNCSPASPTFLMGSCCTQLLRTGTQPKSSAGGSCSLLAGSTANKGTVMLLGPVNSSSSSVWVCRVLGRKATWCKQAAAAQGVRSAASRWCVGLRDEGSARCAAAAYGCNPGVRSSCNVLSNCPGAHALLLLSVTGSHASSAAVSDGCP
jgi:hypothetical protein